MSVRKWIPENCPNRLCKSYVNVVGFLRKQLAAIRKFNSPPKSIDFY